MGSEPNSTEYVTNPLFSKEDWDDMSDNPELSDADLARGRPLTDVMPHLVSAIRQRRGAQKTPTKTLLSLRIDRDVLDAFRSSGPGWQARINATLRKAVGLS